ncbi:MAG: 50S ribosomal protein L14e [Candidatus Woesearchaeota archaeon]
MFEIGRICVKIAGRDAGKACAVVDVINERMVLIDGATRRRKCNIAHLEPLDKKIDIKKGASHEEVVAALKAAGMTID